MLTDEQKHTLRLAADILRGEKRPLTAAMIMTDLDDLGGTNTLSREEHVQKYFDVQATINKACTRRPA